MEDDHQLSKDEIFEVLSSGRRRLLLYHLYRRGGEAGLRELAEDAAAEEFDEPLDEDQIKRIYIAFYQTHVPKLEDVGFVSYAPDDQHVTLKDDVAQIARVLPDEATNDRHWPIYYLLVAIAGLLIAGVSFLEFGFSELISTPLVATLLSILLVVLSVLYYFERRQRRTDLSFLENIVGE